MRDLRLAGVMLFLAALLAGGAGGGEAAPSNLPKEATEALKRGMLAVDQQEWDLAARFFLQAHKAAPAAPEVLFNLGLAESKVPGRELRSIAWFRAYLAAAPKAENAEAVRAQITALEVRAEATMQKLIAQAKTMAGQYQEEWPRKSAYNSTAWAQGQTGDFDGALKTAELGGNDSSTLDGIAVAQAEAGDFAAAISTVRRMKSDETIYNSSAYQDIAKLQAAAGDIVGAEVTLSYSKRDDYRHRGLIAIAHAYAKQGKRKEAHEALARATDFLVKASSKDSRHSSEFYDVASNQAELDDVDGARRTLANIPEKDKWYRDTIGEKIGTAIRARAEEKLKVGDYSGALYLIDGIENVSAKSYAMDRVFRKRLDAKEYGECAALLERMDDVLSCKSEGYASLASRYLDANNKAAAEELLAGARRRLDKLVANGSLADAFIKVGDLTSAERVARALPKDSWYRAGCIQSVMRAQAAAGNARAARGLLGLLEKDADKQAGIRAIGAGQAERGDAKGAVATAAGLTDDKAKTAVLEALGKYQVKNKDARGALETAGLIPGVAEKGSLLANVAELQQKDGDLAAARRTAEGISEVDKRVRALCSLAAAARYAGDLAFAGDVLKSVPESSEKISEYCYLRDALESVGDLRGAAEADRLALSVAEGRGDAYNKAQDYAYYVYYLGSAPPDLVEARRAAAAARRCAAEVSDPAKRAEAYAWGYRSVHNAEKRVGLSAEAVESGWLALESRLLTKEDNWSRRSGLQSAARNFCELGDVASALEVARGIGDADYRSDALTSLAEVLCDRGNFRAAQRLVPEVPEKRRENILRYIGMAQARARDWPAAQATADLLAGKEWGRSAIFEALGRAQVEAGDFAAARATADLLKPGGPRDTVLKALAIAKLRAGDVAGGREAAAQLSSEPEYTLAEEMVKAGETAYLEEVLRKPWRIYWKGYYLKYLATAKLKSGDLKGATALAEELLGGDDYQLKLVCDAAVAAGHLDWVADMVKKFKNEDHRFEVLLACAKAQAGKGETKEAKKAVAKLKRGRPKVMQLVSLARAERDMQDPDAARETLAAIVKRWPEGAKAKELVEVGGVQVHMGDLEAARATLALLRPKNADPAFDSWVQCELATRVPNKQSAEMIDAIQDPRLKWKAYRQQVVGWSEWTAEAGQKAEAIGDVWIKSDTFERWARTAMDKKNLPEALRLAAGIPEDGLRGRFLAELFAKAALAGDFALAGKCAAAVASPALKAYLHLALAGDQLAYGEPKEAPALLAAARDAAAAMPPGYWQAHTLKRIAAAAAAAGDEKLGTETAALAKAAAEKLGPEDRSRLAQELPRPVAAGSADGGTGQAEIAKALSRWKYLLDGDLSKPLFVDLQAELKAIAAKSRSDEILRGTTNAAVEMARMLKQLRKGPQ